MASQTDSFIDYVKQESSQVSTSDEEDSSNARKFSFIENQKNIINLFDSSIYIDDMRSFIRKVKAHVDFLSIDEELSLLLLAVNCIDLTTLSGDDTAANIERLCYKAAHPLDPEHFPEYTSNKCRAVCVYPARINDCVNVLARLDDEYINIASVATAFPSGQCGLKSRLMEIVQAVESGADEIDVVINRTAAIQGDWITIFQELTEMRQACNRRRDEGHDVHMKVIIGAGDLLLSSPSAISFASLVAILAGADFIKTSTGKESVNATLCIGYIMMRTIADYYNVTGVRVGFKPAGGIKTHKDALNWLILVKFLLGAEWMNSDLFRFGASGLLDNIIKRISKIQELKNNN